MSDYWTLIQMLSAAQASVVGINDLTNEAINRHGVWSEHERQTTRDQLSLFVAKSNAAYERLWKALGLLEPTKAEIQQTLAQSILTTDEVARSLGIEIK